MHREAGFNVCGPWIPDLRSPAKAGIARSGHAMLVCRTSAASAPARAERRSGTQEVHTTAEEFGGFDQSPIRLEHTLGLGLRILHRLLGGLRAGERSLEPIVEGLGDALVVMGGELGDRVLQL